MTGSVVFLVGKDSKHFGSTTLRVHQLELMMRPCLALHGVSSSIVISSPEDLQIRKTKCLVSKSFILDYGAEGIERLLKLGNEVILDPLDQQIDRRIISLADRLIASSHQQYAFFDRIKRPSQKNSFVPHHVDLRVPPVVAQRNSLRIAYFGSVYNVRIPGRAGSTRRLERSSKSRVRLTPIHKGFFRNPREWEYIDVISASDPNDTGWIQCLPDYNAHYIFRRTRDFDGFKPFTKGYLAAHCGAVVIGSSDDPEAISHLGADYPFFFRIDTKKDLWDALNATACAFHDERWAVAISRMDSLKLVYNHQTIAESFIDAVLF